MTACRMSRCSPIPEIRDRADPARRLVEDLRDDRLAHGLLGLAEAALRQRPQARGQLPGPASTRRRSLPASRRSTGPQDAVDDDGRRVRPAPEDRGRGAEQAARRLLHHAEGRLLRLPEHLEDRLEGEAARLGAARGGRRRDRSAAPISASTAKAISASPTPTRRRTSARRSTAWAISWQGSTM